MRTSRPYTPPPTRACFRRHRRQPAEIMKPPPDRITIDTQGHGPLPRPVMTLSVQPYGHVFPYGHASCGPAALQPSPSIRHDVVRTSVRTRHSPPPELSNVAGEHDRRTSKARRAGAIGDAPWCRQTFAMQLNGHVLSNLARAWPRHFQRKFLSRVRSSFEQPNPAMTVVATYDDVVRTSVRTCPLRSSCATALTPDPS